MIIKGTQLDASTLKLRLPEWSFARREELRFYECREERSISEFQQAAAERESRISAVHIDRLFLPGHHQSHGSVAYPVLTNISGAGDVPAISPVHRVNSALYVRCLLIAFVI
jgi:hypothetical protein